jgi:hypothetical protein
MGASSDPTPAKLANKAERSAAESVEGDDGTKRNAELQSTVRTQSREAVTVPGQAVACHRASSSFGAQGGGLDHQPDEFARGLCPDHHRHSCISRGCERLHDAAVDSLPQWTH